MCHYKQSFLFWAGFCYFEFFVINCKLFVVSPVFIDIHARLIILNISARSSVGRAPAF